MSATMSGIDHHQLFTLNRSRPTAAVTAAIERLEAAWVEPLSRCFVAEPGAPTCRSRLFSGLDELLAIEPDKAATGFVAEECDLNAFRVLVAEFAVDALTEAQSFLPIVGRLPIEARMPLLRVVIDEFGCGNIDRAHSQLYMQLLDELGLPTDVPSHLPATSSEALAFVNLFYWLAARAESPAWFLGALAHLEASIVDGFRCYVAACERLHIVHDTYYREHVHIDAFHRQEMRSALAILDRHGELDHAAAWGGARLAAATFDSAFAVAVSRARRAP